MKTVLITGANRGIGLGLAKRYLGAGNRVVAACRSPEKLELENEQLVPLKLDVGDSVSIQRAVDVLKEQGLSVDLLINNAGICPIEQRGAWTAEAFADTFAVNAAAPALVVQALAPLMNNGSKIVNMTSGMGSLELNLNPREGLDAYAMSKAALNILTRRLATQLEEDGIGVYAISPGWVQTDMGGAEAPVGVDEAALKLLKTIENVSMEQSGLFLSENGETIPW